MRKSIEAFWREASPLKRILIAGVPVLLVALGGAGAIYAGFSGGGESSSAQEAVIAPTEPAPTATATPAWPTPAPTEPPVSAGLQATDGGGASTGGGGSGGGAASRPYVPPAYLSGPGPIEGTDMTMSVPAIGVNATVYSRTIGENGQMGNPSGAWDVIWYDFSGWDGLGGYPGEPGANAIFAGHVDYIHVGPAVFWSIRNLSPGDTVTVTTGNGPITYAIQWSQWAGPEDDFTGFVAHTGQESITLVTCIGGFSGGHYSNRLIVRGVRV